MCQGILGDISVEYIKDILKILKILKHVLKIFKTS
jgi:hypothetical protein